MLPLGFETKSPHTATTERRCAQPPSWRRATVHAADQGESLLMFRVCTWFGLCRRLDRSDTAQERTTVWRRQATRICNRSCRSPSTLLDRIELHPVSRPPRLLFIRCSATAMASGLTTLGFAALAVGPQTFQCSSQRSTRT